MMLKFINNEDDKITMGFSEYEEEKQQNPQSGDEREITNIDKVEVAQRINATMDLPKSHVFMDMKNVIDKNAQGTVIAENAVDKRSREELLEYVSNPEDVQHMYKVVGNNAIMKFGVTLNRKFNIE